MHLNLVPHNPIVIHFAQEPQHSCRRCLCFLGSTSFLAFCFVVHQPCKMRKQTTVSSFTTRFILKKGTRADANIHKAFACKYISKHICTVVEEWTHGYLCLGYFSSSTHFDLVIRLAQKVRRQCVLVFAHDLGLRGGNCNGLLANTGLFLSTGNKYLFLLYRQILIATLDHCSCFNSPMPGVKFVIEVCDLFSFSPWFLTSDSWEPITSDESPSRTIPIRFLS